VANPEADREDAIWVEGRDVIAVPLVYQADFQRDPRDALLRYGAFPQRARAPWFTNVKPIEECMILPDQV
jgi:hypothetical protein